METKVKTQVLCRTSVLIPKEVRDALVRLANGGSRPLSWEIRQALTEHVERHQHLLDSEAPAA